MTLNTMMVKLKDLDLETVPEISAVCLRLRGKYCEISVSRTPPRFLMKFQNAGLNFSRYFRLKFPTAENFVEKLSIYSWKILKVIDNRILYV